MTNQKAWEGTVLTDLDITAIPGTFTLSAGKAIAKAQAEQSYQACLAESEAEIKRLKEALKTAITERNSFEDETEKLKAEIVNLKALCENKESRFWAQVEKDDKDIIDLHQQTLILKDELTAVRKQVGDIFRDFDKYLREVLDYDPNTLTRWQSLKQKYLSPQEKGKKGG